jgi:hypothetical protein
MDADLDHAGLLVELVLDLAALGDLHHHVEHRRSSGTCADDSIVSTRPS